MTRTQAIDLIKDKLEELPDERVEALAELASAWSKPTVYSTLSDAEKAEIDAALDELDRGEGVPWETIAADLEAKIKTKGS
jgi:predicted transcriptional regulator